MSDKILDQARAGEEIDIFLYQNLQYGHFGIHTDEMSGDGYVTFGKGKAVFSLYENDKVIQDSIAALDEQINKTYAEAEYKVGLIKDQKARLLSLTHKE